MTSAESVATGKQPADAEANHPLCADFYGLSNEPEPLDYSDFIKVKLLRSQPFIQP